MRTVIKGLDTPHGLVIDTVARKAYWCDTGTDNHNSGGRAINRADLDVPEPLERVASLSEPWDADLDLRTTTYAQYDIIYQIEVSDDMEVWQSDSPGNRLTGKEALNPLLGGLEEVTLPITGQGHHIRLRVTLVE